MYWNTKHQHQKTQCKTYMKDSFLRWHGLWFGKWGAPLLQPSECRRGMGEPQEGCLLMDYDRCSWTKNPKAQSANNSCTILHDGQTVCYIATSCSHDKLAACQVETFGIIEGALSPLPSWSFRTWGSRCMKRQPGARPMNFRNARKNVIATLQHCIRRNEVEFDPSAQFLHKGYTKKECAKPIETS